MKKLVKFSCNGRYFDCESLIVVGKVESGLLDSIKNGFDIELYLGEIAGKHSEVVVDLSDFKIESIEVGDKSWDELGGFIATGIDIMYYVCNAILQHLIEVEEMDDIDIDEVMKLKEFSMCDKKFIEYAIENGEY